MSTSAEFTDFILDQLSSLEDLSTSKMFGGVLLKIGNQQLGVIIEDTLYFKVTEPELQIKFQEMDSQQFSYTRKDKIEPVIIKNWWSVPEYILEDRDKLLNLALDAFSQTTL